MNRYLANQLGNSNTIELPQFKNRWISVEKKGKNMKKFVLLFLILGFLNPSFVLASSASDDSTGRDDTQIFHVYGDVDLISTLKFQYGRPRIVIKSVYPQLASDEPNEGVDAFNQLVLDLIDKKISAYKKQVEENQEAQKNIPKAQLKNDLYLDYDASFIQSGKRPIISIRFSVQGYIGGMAHPYHHHFVLNYDLDNREQIDLNDLFKPDTDYLETLSDFTRSVLSRRLHDQHQIMEGTTPSADNFKNWNIKPNGLLITFDEYQVAPYIYGAQTVLVPYSVLKQIIDPDSPIAACVMNKRRCARNNLLTGGFIDEASNMRTINSHHRLFNPLLSKR